MNPWFAFIESNTSGTGRLFARAASREGYLPILFTDDASRYKYVAEDGVTALSVDTQNDEAVLKACRALQSESGLAGVTTSSDYFIAPAAVLASRMGLPGPHPNAVRACRDKHKQRLRLEAAGCGVPTFYAANSVKAAIMMAEKLGYPAVVKPISGSGSVGVKLCRDVFEVMDHAEALLRQRKNERGLEVPHTILIESVASGQEYSVETFCKTVIGITQKYLGPLPDFVEIGHDHPAELPASTHEVIKHAALSALDALGLGWGPAHIEMRVSDDVAKIIEVNPRLAGGYIPELVRLASGIDLISETVRLAAGRQPDLTRLSRQYACIRFIMAEEKGTLVSAEGLDQASQIPSVIEARLYSQPGSEVARRGDFRDRIGHVLTCADDLETARSAALKAHSAIRVVVRQD